MSYFYPPLNEPALRQVIQLYEQYPDYFSAPECPYSPVIKDFLKLHSAASDFDTHKNVSVKLNEQGLEDEIDALYTSLKTYGETAKASDNAADKNTFFRLSVGLLEKIIEVKKNLSYIQSVNVFIEEVLVAMQEILDPDQRNEFLDRIRPYTTGYVPPESSKTPTPTSTPEEL